MKILMVLDHEFPPDIRVENEIASLRRAGHEIHVACYTRKGRPFLENSAGCLIHRRNISTFLYKSSVACLKFPFYFNFWRQFLNQLFLEHSFDAIHIHDLPLAQVGFEMKQKFNVKFVLDLHENWPDYLKNASHTQTMIGKLLSSYKQWLVYETRQCLYADNIIVVIEEAKERLIRRKIQAEKIFVVSNTLNLASFTELRFFPDPEFFTLFYAGGIDAQRGLQTVIEALNRIHKQSIRFWIFGEGKYMQELKKRVNKYGIQDMVKFWGFVPFKEMTTYMVQANAAIIPHIRNDFMDTTIPHKLFQYMYAGLPVLSSDCLPLKRIIQETRSGYIFPSDDPLSLANLIGELSLKKHLQEYNGDNSKKWVLQKYNWEKDATKLLNLYA
jgi:glycosyltransferase involved in cell wall biosynthesis